MSRVDFLGKDWIEDFRNAGSKCSPACELADLRKRLQSQLSILAAYQQNTSPGGSIGGWISLAETKPNILNQPETTFTENITTCTGWCTVRHEAVHRYQIENEWSQHKWVGKRTIEEEAELEIPAYEAGISCLRGLIKMGEDRVRRFGQAACQCGKGPHTAN